MKAFRREIALQKPSARRRIRGIVPTFYIKQVIFSLVEDLESEGIRRIKDEIDVVNPNGLSSLPRE